MPAAKKDVLRDLDNLKANFIASHDYTGAAIVRDAMVLIGKEVPDPVRPPEKLTVMYWVRTGGLSGQGTRHIQEVEVDTSVWLRMSDDGRRSFLMSRMWEDFQCGYTSQREGE